MQGEKNAAGNLLQRSFSGPLLPLRELGVLAVASSIFEKIIPPPWNPS
jgi:hypothetical protein